MVLSAGQGKAENTFGIPKTTPIAVSSRLRLVSMQAFLVSLSAFLVSLMVVLVRFSL